jgi:hypothetical protein
LLQAELPGVVLVTAETAAAVLADCYFIQAPILLMEPHIPLVLAAVVLLYLVTFRALMETAQASLLTQLQLVVVVVRGAVII